VRCDRVRNEERVIFVFLLVSVCLGLVFAFLARDRIRAEGMFAMPALGFVGAFAGFLVAPCALYLAWAHPDWSWMYVVDPSGLSFALAPAWAVVQAGALFLGWAVGGRLVRTVSPRRIAVAVAVLGAAILALVVGLADRLALYGTYETFSYEVGFGLLDVKLGYVLVVMSMALAAAAAQVGLELARDSRRVRAR
jgi:uncharacterized membrane protein YeaQ/YmgE (transglycosylase-associated protein family)